MTTTKKASGTRTRKILVFGSIGAGALLLVVILLFVFSILTINRRNTVSQRIFAADGGTIELAGFRLQIPAETLARDAMISIQFIAANDSKLFQYMTGQVASFGKFFDLTKIFDSSGKPAGIDGEMLLTLPFDPSLLLPSQDENRVIIFYWDDKYQRWIPLLSTVNPKDHTVSAPITGPGIYAPGTSISENQPPDVVEAYFSPSTYSVDCAALQANPDAWLNDHAFSLVLRVSDPDGLDDIQDQPVLTFHPDHNLNAGPDDGPYPLEKKAPGEYRLESNGPLRDLGVLDVFFALARSCGSMNGLRADMKVRDRAGNISSASAMLQVRYSPEPEIELQSPVSNQPVSGTPLLKWDIQKLTTTSATGTSMNTLEKYDSITLEVGLEYGLMRALVLNTSLPLTQRSYQVESGALTTGLRYFWRISLHQRSGQANRSRIASFTTGMPCQAGAGVACLRVLVKRSTGNTLGGARVSLQRDAGPAEVQFTDDSGTVIFEVAPDVAYYLESAAVGYKSWLGKSCLFQVEKNDSIKMDITLERGSGATDVCDEAHQSKSFDISRTPTVTLTPSYTPTLVPTLGSTFTPTPDYPTITLDRDYFCNEGPAETYPKVTSFFAGTTLRVVGTDGHGWWQVKVEHQKVQTCWIGGGVVNSKNQTIPIVPTPPPPSQVGFTDVTVSQPNIDLILRDDQAVDGDQVKVYLNGVVIIADYTLTGQGQAFPIMLNSGVNLITVEALSEGYSSPCTVEVSLTHVTAGPMVQVSAGLSVGATASFNITAP